MMDLCPHFRGSVWKKWNRFTIIVCLGILFWFGKVQAAGFQVNRFEPTPAGEWSFMVDHPWYSSLRYFAAGITLNYAHNPLVFGVRDPMTGDFSKTATVLEHQLIGHVDIAGSFLDRVLLSVSLPVTLMERGTSAFGVNPVDTIGVGDPRLGAMVRIWGQPNKGAFSINAGAYLWLPINHWANAFPSNPQLGEEGVRVKPTIVMAGLPTWGKEGNHGLSWSTTMSAYYRPDAKIGNGGPNSVGDKVGTEVELGVNLGYVNKKYRLQAGVEALGSVTVTNVTAFQKESSRLNLLATFHHNIAKQVNIGVAGGFGLGLQPGNPDGRVLFRLAYAPMKDSGWRNDKDHDGVYDEIDQCPTIPQGKYPDPNRQGCPNDRDGDGVIDEEDVCPDVHMGEHPDPNRRGCPLPPARSDRDKDGVYDDEDMCPDEHMGDHPDPEKRGCPLRDRDGDGVYDNEDMCPDVHMGDHPDPNRKGCPDGDKDGDGIYDSVDACPLVPGVASEDPKKHGCPRNVAVVTKGTIEIFKPIFFAFDDDTIECVKCSENERESKLALNETILNALAEALKANPRIKKLGIHGYADAIGNKIYNIDLSLRRTKSVVKWLIEKGGIDPSRLKAYGHGNVLAKKKQDKSDQTRQKDRRTDFIIEQEDKTP